MLKLHIPLSLPLGTGCGLFSFDFLYCTGGAETNGVGLAGVEGPGLLGAGGAVFVGGGGLGGDDVLV